MNASGAGTAGRDRPRLDVFNHGNVPIAHLHQESFHCTDDFVIGDTTVDARRSTAVPLEFDTPGVRSGSDRPERWYTGSIPFSSGYVVYRVAVDNAAETDCENRRPSPVVYTTPHHTTRVVDHGTRTRDSPSDERNSNEVSQRNIVTPSMRRS